MPPRRWHLGRRTPLTPQFEHFFTTGCIHEGAPNLDVFLLAGGIARRQLDDLRELWAVHGQVVKARAGGGAAVYAEVLLARGEWHGPCRRSWRCAEHPEEKTA